MGYLFHQVCLRHFLSTSDPSISKIPQVGRKSNAPSTIWAFPINHLEEFLSHHPQFQPAHPRSRLSCPESSSPTQTSTQHPAERSTRDGVPKIQHRHPGL